MLVVWWLFVIVVVVVVVWWFIVVVIVVVVVVVVGFLFDIGIPGGCLSIPILDSVSIHYFQIDEQKQISLDRRFVAHTHSS